MTSLVLQFALLASLIVAAGTMLAAAADTIGRLTSLGGTLAGFSLLAAATSLPELVIDCNAAMIEAADLALGDLLGSSLFNLLILGMIDLTHRARLTAIATIGLLYRAEQRYSFFEPNALMVVALSLASIVGVMLINGL